MTVRLQQELYLQHYVNEQNARQNRAKLKQKAASSIEATDFVGTKYAAAAIVKTDLSVRCAIRISLHTFGRNFIHRGVNISLSWRKYTL